MNVKLIEYKLITILCMSVFLFLA